MKQAYITLRQLQPVLHNHVKLYETDDDDGNYTELYCGEMKDVPERLLDRTVFVVWARSSKQYEATVMIELEKEHGA